MDKPVIFTSKLNLTYAQGHANEVNALKNVNLVINRGDLIAISGPSGSGKSSLLHILGAMQTPTSGIVEVNGNNLQNLNRYELARIRREHIGFTFQNFALINHLSALDNVMVPLYPISPPKLKQRALSLLERVGLANRAHHFPTQLSGGERQRVAIARALINNPTIVLGDEITGNLDTKTGEEIFDLIKDLNQVDKITFILVTHDRSIADLCNERIEMKDGMLFRSSGK